MYWYTIIYIYRYQRQIWGEVRFTWVKLMNPPQYQTCMTTLQIWFSDFQVYLLTLLIDPPPYHSNSRTLSLLRNITRHIVKQICFTATCTGIPYIYIQIPKTDMRRSQIYLGKTDEPPLVSYCSNSRTLSLLRNIQRHIVKQISFTATCTGIPYYTNKE